MKRLLVISSYPPKGTVHDRTVVGVAPYTKKAVEAMVDAAKRQDDELDVTVLAEIQVARLTIQKDKNSGQVRMSNEYEENGVKVKRLWKRGNLATFFTLAKEVLRQKTNVQRPTSNIMIGFELSMFGSSLSLLLFPFFLLFLRLLRKDVTLVLHHVITDISEMAGHLNMEKKGLKTNILHIGFSFIYFLIIHICSKIIVFEDVLKERLGAYGKTTHVHVIPLGVESFHVDTTRAEARKKLGIGENQFILISFGFLAWYKGTDWLVDMYEQLKEKIKDQRLTTRLILAGGPNFQRLHFPFYKKYVEDIEKKCHELGITITGFIEEKDIPLYFLAADLLVFPYRTLMSSSGPLTISYSFHTPFLFSKPLKPILQTHDLHEALEKEGVSTDAITFSTTEDFLEKILSFENDATLRNKLHAVSTYVANKRSWVHIGEKYYTVIFQTKK